MKKARVEEEWARKAEIRAKKAEESRKRKGAKQASSSGATSGGEPSTSTASTRTDDEIDVNVCCMCFLRYEDDILAGSGAAVHVGGGRLCRRLCARQ